MHKLTFTLKQHTPIIHFQHDQDGATLRASEVKPKLDRFLIEKLGLTEPVMENGKEKIVPKKEFEHWFNNKERLSLDYKMRIICGGDVTKYFITSNPRSNKYDDNRKELIRNEISSIYVNETQYFANNSNLKPNHIENKEEVKLGLFSSAMAILIIHSFNAKLAEEIKTNMPKFFLKENFGTRQSKGFGCFSVIKVNKEEFHFSENDLKNEFDVVYKLNADIQDKIDALKEIAKIYKLLKSGRGAREFGGYKKSLLFRYYVSKSNPIRWEKRKIKQQIRSSYYQYNLNNGQSQNIELTSNTAPCYNNTNATNWNDIPTPFNYRYIRAVLGLAESFEFLADSIDDGTRTDVRQNRIDFKYVIQVQSNNEIDRYKSPITFKFINQKIYLCADDIDNRILNSSNNDVSFNFDKRLKINNRIRTDRHYVTEDFIQNLKTPDEFNIGDFLDFALNRDEEKIQNFTKLKNTLLSNDKQ